MRQQMNASNCDHQNWLYDTKLLGGVFKRRVRNGETHNSTNFLAVSFCLLRVRERAILAYKNKLLPEIIFWILFTIQKKSTSIFESF
jgi:hypothetical protein